MNHYIQEEMTFNCPYCGAMITALIDFSSGAQQYYEDCGACCSPILFYLTEKESDSLFQ